MKITQAQILKMERAARRITEIESGINITVTRVHRSAKDYTRKDKHKSKTWAD
jgi:hypothetical protein